MLQHIKVSDIYAHPDNPRKDLGDLTELAESIKSNGILQNLVVVPYFSAITRAPLDDPKKQAEAGYRAVIGHRRLAAAKLAGLDTVPCIISDMKPREQVATMLLENIQRNDLTVYEQAQGFQLLLNLGETMDGIAEKTGFSQSTVRRRTKLLELDQDRFAKAVTRGATLMDFAELEKIEDMDARNAVLEKVGTQNFQFELKKAIEKEKEEKDNAWLIEQLKTFATQTDDARGLNLRYIRRYLGAGVRGFVMPDDTDTVKYYYEIERWGGITLYSERTNTAEETAHKEAEQKEKDERDARYAALKEISNRACQLRSDFVCGFSNAQAKKQMSVIMEFAVCAMLDRWRGVDHCGFAETLGIQLDNNDEWKFADIAEQLRKEPERYLLHAAYHILETNETYYARNLVHNGSDELDRIYDFLARLGYEMSDDERAMQDGTHELLVKKEKANA